MGVFRELNSNFVTPFAKILERMRRNQIDFFDFPSSFEGTLKFLSCARNPLQSLNHRTSPKRLHRLHDKITLLLLGWMFIEKERKEGSYLIEL